MNKSEFINIIKEHKMLSGSEYNDITRLVGSYPYFQSARVLLLNSLYKNDDIEFTDKLKETAIFIADREVLYQLLNDKAGMPVQDDGEEAGADKSADRGSGDKGTVKEEPGAEAVTSQEREREVAEEGHPGAVPAAGYEGTGSGEGAGKDAGSEEKGRFETVSGRSREELKREIEIRLAEISGESLLQLDDNISGDEEEQDIQGDSDRDESSMDDDGLLDLDLDDGRQSGIDSSQNEVQADSIDEIRTEGQDRGPEQGDGRLERERESGMEDDRDEAGAGFIDDDELLERFISSNPRIEPGKGLDYAGNEDVPDTEKDESSQLITETLAGIYLSQGYYSKAISIYERLSLKYPEKSTYFATQIEKIREIISKN